MREHEIIKYQQKKVILFLSAIIILVTLMALIKVTGNYIGGAYRLINAIFLAGSFVAIYFTFFKAPTHLRPIMIGLLFILELGVCAELIYCAHNITPYFTTLIVANMTLLAIVLTISLFSYQPKVSYLLAALTISTYTYCAYITNSNHLWALYIIFVILFAVGGVFSYYFTKGMEFMLKENDKLKTDEQKVLIAFGISRAELESYVELSNKNMMKDKPPLDILGLMGNETRERLKKNVSYLVEQDKIIYDKIGEFIPEFTPSEVEIARLIVEGKKITEMMPILNKKKSNITCQRSKMRGKLNLTEKDNLRDAIVKKVTVN